VSGYRRIASAKNEMDIEIRQSIRTLEHILDKDCRALYVIPDHTFVAIEHQTIAARLKTRSEYVNLVHETA
jgi:hypothetical protein